MEVQADRRDLPADPKILQRITLEQLVERYRDTVSVRKQTQVNEQAILNAFLRHSLCRRAVSEITQTDFASYRDDRLRIIKPSSLKRELVPLHNLYEISRHEWGLPIRVNPLSKLKIADADQKRERLRPHEQPILMAEALSCRNKLIAPLIEFALATAMRRGGRFGWGMKSASFSQCKRLTVISGKNGGVSGAEWDLNNVQGWAMGVLSLHELKQTDVCSEPVPVHSVGLPEFGERLRSKTISGETLGATLRRMFEAAPHLDRPDLRSDVAFSRKRANRSVFLQRIRSRARSEEDAIATVVAAENWIKGALTLFVGQPNDDETR